MSEANGPRPRPRPRIPTAGRIEDEDDDEDEHEGNFARGERSENQPNPASQPIAAGAAQAERQRSVMKMKISSYILPVIAVVFVMGCVSPESTRSIVFVHRTQPDEAFVKVHLLNEGVTVERPSGGGRTLEWPLIQLNSIARSSSYIGDTQYLTTINIKKYSSAEWDKQIQWGILIVSGITNSEWKAFQEWFYSEPETTSMRERDGFRYYLRVIKNPRIGVIEIRGEHNCFQRQYAEQDDKVVRRIMDSVAFEHEAETKTEQDKD